MTRDSGVASDLAFPFARSLRAALAASAGGAGIARWQLIAAPRVDSTQRLAAEAARVSTQLGERWLLAVAAAQDAGRGRGGKAWMAAPGQAWLWTLGASLAAPAETWPRASLVVAAALAHHLSAATGHAVRVKWPNDLVVIRDGAWRKLGGCLCERMERPGLPAVWLCGIGINLRRQGLPAALAAACASLEDLGVAVADGAPELAAASIEAARGAVEAWQDRRGELDRPTLASMLAFVGVTVALQLDDGGSVQRGELLGVEADGRLRLRHEGGDERVWLPLAITGAAGDPPWHPPPPITRTV